MEFRRIDVSFTYSNKWLFVPGGNGALNVEMFILNDLNIIINMLDIFYQGWLLYSPAFNIITLIDSLNSK